jgi:hypothetical protein
VEQVTGPPFRKARAAPRTGNATARLQQASSAAVSALLKIVVDLSALACTRLRPEDILLAHMAKAPNLSL